MYYADRHPVERAVVCSLPPRIYNKEAHIESLCAGITEHMRHIEGMAHVDVENGLLWLEDCTPTDILFAMGYAQCYLDCGSPFT